MKKSKRTGQRITGSFPVLSRHLPVLKGFRVRGETGESRSSGGGERGRERGREREGGEMAGTEGGGGVGVGKESVVTIVWDSGRQRFASQDGQAYLEYKLKPPPPPAVSSAVALPINNGKQVMDVLHTFVPAGKRGLGLASKLCIAAFTHARDHNMLVLPTCSYVSDTFIPRHPDWNSLVVPESFNPKL